jgi:hypothetical protein
MWAIPNDMINAFNKLKSIFSSYLTEYRFKKQCIFYDCTVNPKNHVQANYNLVNICETEKYQLFQCFPLRNSWTPAYIQIDTMTLRDHILHEAEGTFTMKEEEPNMTGLSITELREPLGDAS